MDVTLPSRLAHGVPQPDSANLLEVRDLAKLFPITQGFFRRTVGYVRAVDGVSFTIPKGKTLGLVGESGCGKTTTSRMPAAEIIRASATDNVGQRDAGSR